MTDMRTPFGKRELQDIPVRDSLALLPNNTLRHLMSELGLKIPESRTNANNLMAGMIADHVGKVTLTITWDHPSERPDFL